MKIQAETLEVHFIIKVGVLEMLQSGAHTSRSNAKGQKHLIMFTRREENWRNYAFWVHFIRRQTAYESEFVFHCER